MIFDGGIGITNLDSKDKAIKATWISCLRTTIHAVKNIDSLCRARNITINYL